jgi:hypothetical protein
VRRRADEQTGQPPPLPPLPGNASAVGRSTPAPTADWSTAARAEAATPTPAEAARAAGPRAARRAASRDAQPEAAQPETPPAPPGGRAARRTQTPPVEGRRAQAAPARRTQTPPVEGRRTEGRRAQARRAQARRAQAAPARRTLAARLGLPPRKPDPEPLEGKPVRILYLGTAAWLVAFAILVPYYDRLMTAGRGSWLWTCLAGFGLGLWGIHLTRRREAAAGRRNKDRRMGSPTSS